MAQKLVDAKVNGVIGHLNSGTTIPASKIYSDAGIAQISPSATNPKYTEQGFKTAFRVMPNDVQQGKVLGEYRREPAWAPRKSPSSMTAPLMARDWRTSSRKRRKPRAREIVAHEFTTDKSTDFMAILTAVKGKNADLLFFGGMDPQGGPMVKQFKTLGLNAKFLMGDGGCTPEFIKLAGRPQPKARTARCPACRWTRCRAARRLATRFTAKYGQIQLYAPYCYDAVNVMIAAMQKAGSAEPAKYLPELARSAMTGVTAKSASTTRATSRMAPSPCIR